LIVIAVFVFEAVPSCALFTLSLAFAVPLPLRQLDRVLYDGMLVLLDVRVIAIMVSPVAAFADGGRRKLLVTAREHAAGYGVVALGTL
jgi:hypothetical protein